MLTFTNHLDYRIVNTAPQVARINLAIRTRLEDPANLHETTVTKYICIGTPYGYIHTSDGNMRTWDSYSGARKFLVKYCIDNELATPATSDTAGK